MPVWSDSVARTDDGALTVGGVDVRALASEYGTPLYVAGLFLIGDEAGIFAGNRHLALGQGELGIAEHAVKEWPVFKQLVQHFRLITMIDAPSL